MIRQAFPHFDEADFVNLVCEKALYMNCATDMELMSMGSIVKYVPLVLKGSVKVMRQDESGKAVFLYYILSGESCPMTLNACYHHQNSAIKAIVQEPTELLLVPVQVVYEAAKKYVCWQRFAFETFTSRFDQLLQVLENVMFKQLDERLLHYLTDKARALKTPILHISNQQIADELGSSREVISRLIKQFEIKGLLRHEQRGIIEIIEKP